MNEAFWEKFPKTAKIRCIELKDQAQERVVRETRGLSSDQLFAYFRDASRRFRMKLGRTYPESTPTPVAVRETGPRGNRR